MPEYENSQSNVHVGTQCYAILKVNKHEMYPIYTLSLFIDKTYK